MINIVHKKQGGFSTLTTTVIVLLSATIISLFTTTAVLTRQQAIANQFHTQQALHAAQAGLNYGVTYLTENRSTVTDGQTLTGSLADGSTYSLVFTFQGNNNLIRIASTGANPDGTSTKTVQQLATYTEEAGGAATIPPVPLRSRGSINVSGNGIIRNYESDFTVVTGGSINFSGNGKTQISSGTSSDSRSIESDVVQGDLNLAGKSDNDLQVDTVGQPLTAFQSQADASYSNSRNTNYNNELNRVTNQTIYINQSGGKASINGNTRIGSSSEPVTIVVNGDFETSGNTIIYGNIYVTGELKMSGNTRIYGLVLQVDSNEQIRMSGNTIIDGAVVGGGSIRMSGNGRIVYDTNILNSTMTVTTSTTGSYSKVPGSWTDL